MKARHADADSASAASDASQSTVTLHSAPQRVAPASTSPVVTAHSTTPPRRGPKLDPNNANSTRTSPSASPSRPRSIQARPQERRLHADPVSYGSSITSSLLESTDTEAGESGGTFTGYSAYSTFSNVDAESSTMGARAPGERKKKRKSRRPSAPSVPFPSQVDPSKPLRPRHYRRGKVQRWTVRWAHRSEGMLLFALAQAFVAACFPLVDLLGDMHSDYILFTQMGVCTLCSWLFLVLSGTPFRVLGPPRTWLLLLLRGIMGALAFGSFRLSLRSLDPSDATALFFLAPGTTSILGSFFLDEPILWREIIGAITSFSGATVLSRPASLFSEGGSGSLPPGLLRPTSRLSLPNWPLVRDAIHVPWDAPWLGLLQALLGVLALASSFILVRRIGSRATPLHNVACYSLVGTAVLAMCLMWQQQQAPALTLPGERDCLLLLLSGFLIFCSEMLIALSLQRSKAGRTTSTLSFQLLFTLLIQGFLSHPLPPLTLLGCSLIVIGAGYISLIKR